MAFLVLAFPILNKENFNWIQSYRKENDKYLYKVVNPHFTIIFPLRGMSKTAFLDEIYIQSKGLCAIEFAIEKTILFKNTFDDYYHEFLVPSKGYNEIVNIHDKLYSHQLLPYLRSEIEYIPHIGIGKSKNQSISKQRIDNLRIPPITGHIEKLTVANFEKNKISEMAVIRLV
jgi:2'-5' RNA ligase